MALEHHPARTIRVTSASRPRPTAGTIEHTQSLAVRLAGAAALLTFALAVYARSLDMLQTDVPLRDSNGRLYWFASVACAVGFGIVVQQVSTRRSRSNVATTAAGASVLPALVVFAALQFVAWDSRTAIVIAAPLLAAAGVFTAVVVRHYLLSGDPAVLPGARLVHIVLTAGVAFLALSLARGWMAGSLYTLVVVFIIAGLLLYQASDGVRTFPIRRVAYALAGGAVVAETALALNNWPPSGWYGGAMLSTVFVVMMLTIEAILSRRISIDVVTRYTGAGVAVCGLLAILAR